MDLQAFSEILKVFLQVANIVVLGYALYKFLNKPHDTLEEKHEELKKRVDEHDVKIREVEKSLHQGNDKFREQDETNAAFKSVMLAFVDFEIAYCLHTNYEFTDDLMRAKKELQDYLSRGGKHEKDERKENR